MRIIRKRLSETPLEAVERFRNSHAGLDQVTLSYAGRLDPMASGLLLVLEGDENKDRRIYERISKTYVCRVCFGVSTDSADTLGCVTEIRQTDLTVSQKERIATWLNSLSGKTLSQRVPRYSSVPYRGKPLYWWSRHNPVEDSELPVKEVFVHEVRMLGWDVIDGRYIAREAIRRASLVKGDFRQDAIKKSWRRSGIRTMRVPIAVFRISCAGGFYVRSLAQEIGRKAGHTPSMLYGLERVAIGDAVRVGKTDRSSIIG